MDEIRIAKLRRTAGLATQGRRDIDRHGIINEHGEALFVTGSDAELREARAAIKGDKP